MQRYLLIIAALMILGLDSCSKVEAGNEKKTNGIYFTAEDASVAKDPALNTINLNSFYVSSVQENGTAYFKDLNVFTKDGGNSWESDYVYAWPKGSLEFYAYSNANGQISVDASGMQFAGFTVPEDIDEQKDFVVAYNKGSAEDFAAQGVHLLFKHATSSVSIKAVNDSDIYIVKVYGIKIANLRGSDTFTFVHNSLTEHCWSKWFNSAYDPTSTTYVCKYLYNEPVVLDKNASSVSDGANIYLIPQCMGKWKATSAETNTLENRGAYISLLVNITTVDGTPIYPSRKDYYTNGVNAAWDAVGVEVEWLPGRHYEYTLNFLHNGSGAGQKDPDEPEIPGSGGDVILGGLITLNLGIEEWLPGGDTEIILDK